MMFQNTARTTLGLALVMGIPMSAGAQGPGFGGDGRFGGGRGCDHGRGPGFGWGMIDDLDLSQRQRDEIIRLRTMMWQQLDWIDEQMSELREQMRALWTVEQPDAQAILQKHAEMDPLRQARRAARVRFAVAVTAVLTPGQRAARRDAMSSGQAYPQGGRRRGRGHRGRGCVHGHGHGRGRGGGGPGW